jgi:hypothetical protein
MFNAVFLKNKKTCLRKILYLTSTHRHQLPFFFWTCFSKTPCIKVKIGEICFVMFTLFHLDRVEFPGVSCLDLAGVFPGGLGGKPESHRRRSDEKSGVALCHREIPIVKRTFSNGALRVGKTKSRPRRHPAARSGGRPPQW